MGKPKEFASTDDESSVGGGGLETTLTAMAAQKRHKRHKHKRHKKKKLTLKDANGLVNYGNIVDSGKKKNCKVRGKKLVEAKGFSNVHSDRIIDSPLSGTVSTNLKNFTTGYGGMASTMNSPCTTSSLTSMTNSANTTMSRTAAKKRIQKSGKSKDSGTSSEEERWLDAIESGKLEEVDDELKKIKPRDPKLMTARQRAMFERKTDMEPNPGVERLVSLPSGYKEKVMTAEAIQKAALKSLKRKQLADEKREKDKKKTMERLLKKQESKASKFTGKGKAWKRQMPLISYRLTVQGSCISLPAGQDIPLYLTSSSKKNQLSTDCSNRVVSCSMEGCSRPKKYSCSKTGIPLCSLKCYQANLAAILA